MKPTREALRYMRLHVGLSTVEMAHAMGYVQSYVSMVETGRRNITDEYVRRVLSVLDIVMKEDRGNCQ